MELVMDVLVTSNRQALIRGNSGEDDPAASAWRWLMDNSMAGTEIQWPQLGARSGLKAALLVLSGSLLVVLLPLSGLDGQYRAALNVLLQCNLWGGNERLHTYGGQTTGLAVASTAIELLVFKQKTVFR
ncbi:unnamed protein product [Ranitomeya imitator]|uniref:Uncharacterized protein n=1 Tax=Ranitomeya imitator TaxID=111125 RepID=A0ABN9LYM5_9NEOB|nr:unnamed protein product [Ranitomeya imitator]